MTETEQSEKEMLVELAVNAVNNRIRNEGTCSITDFRGSYVLICITTLGVSDDIPLPLSEVESEKCVRSLLYKRFHDLKNYALKM
jgi:hypothetical protein